ncbi:copper resistance D family protein [Williamsia sterculiae]|uniref:Putative copper resistance protein D/copper transport protein n=1 Tax=Williamsia sterculiae TaxID=1344003 RepID=A0A1N7GA65_9NOCA|nr:CopD family protein [Williamsia sterculiae]SIS09480.1 putative copper resistance protein D/copper transport protein [Williamsia sterculiae]
MRPVATPLTRIVAGRLLGWGALALLVSDYLQVAARTARAEKHLTFVQALNPDRMGAYLTRSAGREAWISAGELTAVHVAVVLLAAALLVPLLTSWGVARIDRLAGVALPVVLLASLVRSTPADASQLSRDELVNRILAQGHIIAGTSWVGGLLLLAVIARSRVLDVDDRAQRWALIWQRFSTVALVSVGVVLTSGLWLVWKEFGHVSQLWSTTYGRFLLFKLLLVALMVGAGAFNQMWLLPRTSRGSALSHLRMVVAVEALLGIGVIAVVPFLTGSPRSQAGDNGTEHTATLGILSLGLLIAAVLGLSLFTTARASAVLTRRQVSTSVVA